MLDLNAFAKEVHAVSVEHGWWEGEENNDIDTKIALIHAEWSEALEEYRAGRPMVYALDIEGDEEITPRYETDADKFAGRKPEGIAVELVDGVIRILDLMAAKDRDFAQVGYVYGVKRTLPQLVAALHYETAKSGTEVDFAEIWLNSCIEAVREWLEDQGVDVDELMRLKHEYNKTRSYRHGGKRC